MSSHRRFRTLESLETRVLMAADLGVDAPAVDPKALAASVYVGQPMVQDLDPSKLVDSIADHALDSESGQQVLKPALSVEISKGGLSADRDAQLRQDDPVKPLGNGFYDVQTKNGYRIRLRLEPGDEIGFDQDGNVSAKSPGIDRWLISTDDGFDLQWDGAEVYRNGGDNGEDEDGDLVARSWASGNSKGQIFFTGAETVEDEWEDDEVQWAWEDSSSDDSGGDSSDDPSDDAVEWAWDDTNDDDNNGEDDEKVEWGVEGEDEGGCVPGDGDYAPYTDDDSNKLGVPDVIGDFDRDPASDEAGGEGGGAEVPAFAISGGSVVDPKPGDEGDYGSQAVADDMLEEKLADFVFAGFYGDIDPAPMV
ncbi:hypothetical protein Pla123a_03040 [Posidoniimonas polymericola]|uniref:Uncharacterized protein n=1 Tax=Posidoniimonas polymericola TaxID=2528002 RepID=A0A5C5ZEL4_9BACT|nr:hypothetical protein [Posidoniimonas polymericola]TWT85497.1 hypothetical protein Pla123a_03040 [Posidoniimonas polymericola]